MYQIVFSPPWLLAVTSHTTLQLSFHELGLDPLALHRRKVTDVSFRAVCVSGGPIGGGRHIYTTIHAKPLPDYITSSECFW